MTRKELVSYMKFLVSFPLLSLSFTNPQVSVVPISLDAEVMAYIVIIPPDICAKIPGARSQVSAKLLHEATLIAALFPLVLTTHKQQQASDWKKHYIPTRALSDPIRRRFHAKSPLALAMKPSNPLERGLPIQLAVGILQYPYWLDDYMADLIPQKGRPYFIWEVGDSQSKSKTTWETRLLRSILGLYPLAKEVGLKAETLRAIFIHAGMLKALHSFEGLWKWRKYSVQTMFVTYGTHEDVHPSRWGFREIFTLGEWCIHYAPS